MLGQATSTPINVINERAG